MSGPTRDLSTDEVKQRASGVLDAIYRDQWTLPTREVQKMLVDFDEALKGLSWRLSLLNAQAAVDRGNKNVRDAQNRLRTAERVLVDMKGATHAPGSTK